MKYKAVIQGTVGKWTVQLVNINLKPEYAPYYGNAYRITCVYISTVNK